MGCREVFQSAQDLSNSHGIGLRETEAGLAIIGSQMCVLQVWAVGFSLVRLARLQVS